MILNVDQKSLFPKFQGFEVTFNEVFLQILLERVNQLKKFQNGEVPINLAATTHSIRMDFCVEELGEVAKSIRSRYYENDTSPRAATHYDFEKEIEKELLQLTTHLVTWISSIGELDAAG